MFVSVVLYMCSVFLCDMCVDACTSMGARYILVLMCVCAC